jgi:hypothetical protein
VIETGLRLVGGGASSKGAQRLAHAASDSGRSRAMLLKDNEDEEVEIEGDIEGKGAFDDAAFVERVVEKGIEGDEI